MKKLCLPLAILFVSIQVFADSNIKTVKTTLKEATVYFNGAQLSKTGEVFVNKGRNEIIFDQIESSIYDESILLDLPRNLEILDFKVETPKMKIKKTETLPIELKLKQKELSDIGKEYDLIVESTKVLTSQKNYLLTSKMPKIENENSLSVEELSKLLIFYEEKYFELTQKVNDKISLQEKLKVALKEKQDEITNWRKKNNLELKYNPNSNTKQIKVIVNSKQAASVNMSLQYVVKNAGWSPSYDIKSDGTDKPLILSYKCNLYQNTGSDWTNVKLKISSSNPFTNKVKPELKTFFVNDYNPQDQNLVLAKGRQILISPATTRWEKGRPDPNCLSANPEDCMVRCLVEVPAKYKTIEAQKMANDLNQVDILKELHTIPTNNIEQTLLVKEVKIANTKYKYQAVPKINSNVYLTVSIPEWERLNLLKGPANLFFDRTYIGKTVINPELIEEELMLSLGIDRSLQVERKKLKTDFESNFLSSAKTKTINYEIAIKNNKLFPVTVEIEDQIPISNNEEISISIYDNNNAKFDSETGGLIWVKEIKPKEIEKINYSFEVTTPKEKDIKL